MNKIEITSIDIKELKSLNISFDKPLTAIMGVMVLENQPSFMLLLVASRQKQTGEKIGNLVIFLPQIQTLVGRIAVLHYASILLKKQEQGMKAGFTKRTQTDGLLDMRTVQYVILFI